MADAWVATASNRPVAEATGHGDRVGEEIGGPRRVADRLLEHRVLVERRGRCVLVTQLTVGGDRRLDPDEVARSVAAAQREPGARQQGLHAQRVRSGAASSVASSQRSPSAK